MSRPPYTIAEARQRLVLSDKSVRRLLKVGQLREVGRDDIGRILIDPATVEAAAEQLGRAARRPDSVELPPALQEATSANLAAVEGLLEVLRNQQAAISAQQERILELERTNARLEAERQYLVTVQPRVSTPPAADQVSTPLSTPPERGPVGRWLRRLLGRA